MTVLRSEGGFGWRWAVLWLAIGAVLHLGLFSVPRAVRSARSIDWWAAVALVMAGGAAYGIVALTMAGDTLAARRFGMPADWSAVGLGLLALSMVTLHGLASTWMLAARRGPVGSDTPRHHIRLQEAYFVDHGRYAGPDDRQAFPVPAGISLEILYSSGAGHGALAQADVTWMCAVWVGEPLPLLDHDQPARPVCDLPRRFEPMRAAMARRTQQR